MIPEPIRAEKPLLQLLDDPNRSVVNSAIRTLEYYPTRSVAAHLYDPDMQRIIQSKAYHESAEKYAVEALRGKFLDALIETPELHAWMEPVLPLLAFTEAELSPDPEPDYVYTSPRKDKAVPSFEKFVARYNNFDSKWSEKEDHLRQYDWTTIPADETNKWIDYATTHPYLCVRYISAEMAAVKDLPDTLVKLAQDPHELIQKTAIYQSPDSGAAEILLARLASLRGIAWSECFKSYLHHADREQVQQQLVDMALAAKTDEVRTHIVKSLELGYARKLFHLTAEPPLVDWSFHIAVLNVCHENQIEPHWLPEIETIDNLDVAQAIIQFA